MLIWVDGTDGVVIHVVRLMAVVLLFAEAAGNVMVDVVDTVTAAVVVAVVVEERFA